MKSGSGFETRLGIIHTHEISIIQLNVPVVAFTLNTSPAQKNWPTCHIDPSGCIIFLVLIISSAGMIGRLMETDVLFQSQGKVPVVSLCAAVLSNF